MLVEAAASNKITSLLEVEGWARAGGDICGKALDLGWMAIVLMLVKRLGIDSIISPRSCSCVPSTAPWEWGNCVWVCWDHGKSECTVTWRAQSGPKSKIKSIYIQKYKVTTESRAGCRRHQRKLDILTCHWETRAEILRGVRPCPIKPNKNKIKDQVNWQYQGLNSKHCYNQLPHGLH